MLNLTPPRHTPTLPTREIAQNVSNAQTPVIPHQRSNESDRPNEILILSEGRCTLWLVEVAR